MKSTSLVLLAKCYAIFDKNAMTILQKKLQFLNVDTHKRLDMHNGTMQ